MSNVSAEHLEGVIRTYFDGCNESDAAKMISCMEPEAVHYFPDGAPQGTFFGAEAIAAGWVNAVAVLGSIWTIDRMLVSASRLEAVIEWTHFKTTPGIYLRGDEWYVFSESGLIREIRAYYAAPAAADPRNHFLGDFDYRGLGYPMAPPAVER